MVDVKNSELPNFEEAYTYLAGLDGQQINTPNGTAEVHIKPDMGEFPTKIGFATLTITKCDFEEKYIIGEPGNTYSGLTKVVYRPRQMHQTLLGKPFVNYGNPTTLPSFYPEDGGYKPGTPGWKEYQLKSEFAALNLINRFKGIQKR